MEASRVRGDIQLHSLGATTLQHRSNRLVRLPGGNIYRFFVAPDFSLYWIKSTDGGFTWSLPIVVRNGVTDQIAVWFDQWTPGDAGTKIHLAYIENVTDDVHYRNIDTASDSLSTDTIILAGASAVKGVDEDVTIAKMRGGNLLCMACIDAGVEIVTARSTDGGGTWAARTNAVETNDWMLLAPGFAADNQDAIAIYWDRSANEISRKVYDDSLDSWAETSIATGFTMPVNNNGVPQFAIAIDEASSKILLAAWTERDLLNADLRFWTIDETTITEGGTIVLNSTDDQGMCGVVHNEIDDSITVFYAGKTDGSETFAAAPGTHIYYKVSTDGGTNWGAETKLTVQQAPMTELEVAPQSFGWPPDVCWYADNTVDAYKYSVLLPTRRLQSLVVA